MIERGKNNGAVVLALHIVYFMLIRNWPKVQVPSEIQNDMFYMYIFLHFALFVKILITNLRPKIMTLKLNILAQFMKLNVKVRYFPHICAKNNISKVRMLGFYVAKTNYEKEQGN